MKLAQLPPNPNREVEVPDGYVRPHFIGLALGACKSGKSYTTATFLKTMMEAKCFTRLFVLSPSWWTNSFAFEAAGVNPADAFTSLDQSEKALEEVLKRIRADHEAHKSNTEHWAIWAKAEKGKLLTAREAQLIETRGKPTARVPLPSPCLVLDDCQSSKLPSTKRFLSLALRHRHVCHSPQVGLSIMILSQSLRAGACPRALRPCVNLWMVFPTRDNSQLRDLYTELSGHLTWAEFQRLAEHCWSGERGYLVADLTQSDPSKMFKRCLDGPWINIDQLTSA